MLRPGAVSHNILRIDGALQNVKGTAEITKFTDSATELDLTSLYSPAATQVTRTLQLFGQRAMRTVDQLIGLRPNACVSYQLCTQAKVEIISEERLRLRHGRKALIIEKNHPGAWQIVEAEKLRDPRESANPRAKFISFTVLAAKEGSLQIEVTLTPETP